MMSLLGSKRSQTLTIDLSNFSLLTRLVVKELIELSMKHNRMLDASDLHIQNFFALLENMLLHGIKSRVGLFPDRKSLWHLLESIDKDFHGGFSIADIVWQLSNIKTPLGKCRAWLRLAFVQKHLPDSFRRLIEKREALLDYYEPNAYIFKDDAAIVAGYLVGLNIIDLTWYARDEDLDGWYVSFDFKPYLKDLRELSQQNTINGDLPSNIEVVLDQKNYLEELNRNLNLKVISLQRCIDQLKGKATDKSLSQIVHEIKQPIKQTDEVSSIVADSTNLESSSQTESEELNNEQQLTNDQILLDKEKTAKLEARIESILASEKQKEEAVRLLEKDIHEKQDTIISLGRQIDDIRSINTQLSTKIKESETKFKRQIEQIASLEHRNGVLDTTLCQLSEKIASMERNTIDSEQQQQRLNEMILEKDQKKASLESELRKEKEWRISLQSIVDEQQEQITSFMGEIDQLRSSAADLKAAKKEIESLKFRCSEYELSLEEMGSLLKESRLEADSLKETAGMAKEAHWTRDEDAAKCALCNRAFSVAWRKHHCRNCGNIYCGPCSDNKLPLPSSSKPVRVCDNCHTKLLGRYSA